MSQDQDNKRLLLIDLSARLPYGVIIRVYDDEHKSYFDSYVKSIGVDSDRIEVEETNLNELDFIPYSYYDLTDCKPYLRPMSSMTEEEKKQFSNFIDKTQTYRQEVCLDADSMINPIIGGYKCVYWGLFDKCIDWLLRHHLDFRGLIPLGLALEAPEGMY